MKENLRRSDDNSGILEITRKDNHQSFKMDVGDKAEILLPERHVNDYQWVIVELDEKVLKKLIEEYTDPSPEKKKGAYGQKLIVLEAVSSGQTGVVLHYRRPQELGRELSEVFNIRVDVSSVD